MRTSSFVPRAARSLAMLLTLGLGAALAAPPAPVGTQVPGFYRHAVGALEVTALYDGFVDLPPQLLKGMAPEQVQSLLARMFIANDKGVQTAVNGFLVHTGSQLVLVDVGAAQCFGPTLGQMGANLKASGYGLEQVDAVLLTHMHADHLCGLLDAERKPAFPNATVWVAKADADFWLDERTAEKAPEGVRPMFKMARDAVSPYRAQGRFKTFVPGQVLMPGLEVVDTHGHTPGHSSYMFRSGASQLLVWGDIVHSHAVQFAHPEVAIEFDTDPQQAVSTRQSVFEQMARTGAWVAAAHLPFPGIGHVRKDAQGYAWVPVEYGPLRRDR